MHKGQTTLVYTAFSCTSSSANDIWEMIPPCGSHSQLKRKKFVFGGGGGRVAIMAFGPMGYAMSDNLLRCNAVCHLQCMSVKTPWCFRICAVFS